MKYSDMRNHMLCLRYLGYHHHMEKKKAAKPVWKKPAPKNGRHTKLTEAQKEAARERAAKAGRRYPNLVDNMWVAKKAKTKT